MDGKERCKVSYNPVKIRNRLKAASEIVRYLRQQGVTVAAPKCDASSLASLSKALGDCGEAMPPVRGCINAAMVLNVSTHNSQESLSSRF